MKPPLHQDLGSPCSQGLLNFPEDLLRAQEITLRVSRRPVKGAEPAAAKTDVGIIDVPVYDKGYDSPGMFELSDFIRKPPESKEISPLQQKKPLLRA
jgi:hypothetical protein